MKTLNLVPIKPSLDFISKRKLFFVFSSLLLLLSMVLYMTRSLNYGIDFKGGIMLEIRTTQESSVGQMRGLLSDLSLGEISLQEFGKATDYNSHSKTNGW